MTVNSDVALGARELNVTIVIWEIVVGVWRVKMMRSGLPMTDLTPTQIIEYFDKMALVAVQASPQTPFTERVYNSFQGQ